MSIILILLAVHVTAQTCFKPNPVSFGPPVGIPVTDLTILNGSAAPDITKYHKLQQLTYCTNRNGLLLSLQATLRPSY